MQLLSKLSRIIKESAANNNNVEQPSSCLSPLPLPPQETCESFMLQLNPKRYQSDAFSFKANFLNNISFHLAFLFAFSNLLGNFFSKENFSLMRAHRMWIECELKALKENQISSQSDFSFEIGTENCSLEMAMSLSQFHLSSQLNESIQSFNLHDIPFEYFSTSQWIHLHDLKLLHSGVNGV